MRRRLWLLVAAALVVVVLLLYPSSQCRVTESDLTISRPKAFVVAVEGGFAAGFLFNVTNGAKCGVNAEKLRAILHSVVYQNGTQVAQNLDEEEGQVGTLNPGESGTFSYTFNSYLNDRPAKLVLRIEITFTETGSILVFDGELPVPG